MADNSDEKLLDSAPSSSAMPVSPSTGGKGKDSVHSATPDSAPSSPAALNSPSTSGEKQPPGSGTLSSSPSPPMSPSASGSDFGNEDLAGGSQSFSSPMFAKYRPVTKSPSDGAEVRWYFSKARLGRDDVAAKVPATDVVGKAEYLRFSKRDSLSLEAAFLQREEELVSAWWKEYAECSEGPSGSGVTSHVEGFGDISPPAESSERSLSYGHGKDSFSSKREGLLQDEEENVGVMVKGGLYEVDLLKRRCKPVYWRGDNMRVLRGHWFARRTGLDWLPLREDVAEQLESAYGSQVWRRRSYQPSGQFAARVNLKSSTQGLHALFFGEDDTWEAVLSIDATRVASVLGIRGTGFKLRRGFSPSEAAQPSQEEQAQRKEEDMDDYCSEVPVRHVVFMVHGIGQRLEKANLVDDVGTFRRTAAAMAEQHLTLHQRNAQRVLFIPCQWRRELKLRGETAVENCTLDGVRALRTMLSATVHDVLYYMSPVFCQDIIDSVSSSLNKLYRQFIKRNPGYDGKISIYGHSLGSVLSYDILCHQHDLVSTLPIQEVTSATSREFKESLTTTESVPGKDNSDSDEEKQDTSTQQMEELPATGIDSGPGEHDVEPNKEDSSELESLREQVAALQVKLLALEQKSQDKVQTSPGDLSENRGKEVLQDSKHSLKGSSSERRDQLTNSDSLSSSRKHDFQISYTKLEFEVDTFFAVGSPLGVFLSLRNIRLGTGEGQEYWEDDTIEEELPACRQLMNIFHPYDPVAYRIEPLVCKELVGRRPVFVPYHKGGKRIHIGMQELGENLSAQSKAIVSSITSVRTRMASAFSSPSGEKKDGSDSDDVRPTYGSLMMERLTGNRHGRIDHMLQDATFEHQYIAAISSHTSYWQDHDTALFIVKHLYKDYPEENPALDNSDDGTLQGDMDGAEDEAAFTFFGKEELVAAMANAERAGTP